MHSFTDQLDGPKALQRDWLLNPLHQTIPGSHIAHYSLLQQSILSLGDLLNAVFSLNCYLWNSKFLGVRDQHHI